MNTNSTTSETLKKLVAITTDATVAATTTAEDAIVDATTTAEDAIMDATIDAVMTDSTVTHTGFRDTSVAAAHNQLLVTAARATQLTTATIQDIALRATATTAMAAADTITE